MYNKIVIIFDEATSNMNVYSKQQINRLPSAKLKK